jgi:hypothetical protein
MMKRIICEYSRRKKARHLIRRPEPLQTKGKKKTHLIRGFIAWNVAFTIQVVQRVERGAAACGLFVIRVTRAEEAVASDTAHCCAIQVVHASIAAVAKLSGFPKAVAHVRREAYHVFVFRAVISVHVENLVPGPGDIAHPSVESVVPSG